MLSPNDIIGINVYTIHRIAENKNGGDMLLLYMGYTEQSRIQQTNQSRSTDKFMMKKFGRGKSRFTNAKNGLKEMGLINMIGIKGSDGKFKAFYVKTNYLINEQKVRSASIEYQIQSLPPQPGNTPTGEWETNALSIKEKCLNNKNNIHSSNEEVLISSFGLSMLDIEKMFNHKKSLETILNMCLYIKTISNRLGIKPIYNKDTINATHIMWNNSKLNNINEFLDKIRDGWIYDGNDYQDLIRSDYYLPYEIDDL